MVGELCGVVIKGMVEELCGVVIKGMVGELRGVWMLVWYGMVCELVLRVVLCDVMRVCRESCVM